jgi:hypothetical protein
MPAAAAVDRAFVLALIASLAISSHASAQTLTVGNGGMYATIAAAAAAATDGATIEIAAGTYHEEVVWTANALTIRGIGSVAIDMTGMPLVNQGGKGIFIIDGANATIENITFVGASDSSGNGAGIRWQGEGMLTVRGCVFRANEDGILGGNHADNVALIENNEFVGNGLGMYGYTHSLYISEIDTLTFRGNWSHALAGGTPDIGHLFKSRAHHNYVLYNRLTAEDTHASYELQLPEGGIGYVIGNLIEQGTMDPNRTIISIGGDGMQWPDHHVFIVNNTIVNADTSGTFVAATATIDLDVVNNLFIGAGTVLSGGNVLRMTHNLSQGTSVLVNAAGFDYHLALGSAPIDAGIDPGMDGTMSLAPMLQYVHPRATEPRAIVGVIDIGAYEFGSASSVDASARDGGRGDAAVAMPHTSGGCCGVAARRSPLTTFVSIAIVAWLLHRRRAT